MLLDTLAIAYRIHVRHHYVRRFAAHQRQRVDDALQTVTGVEAESATGSVK